MAEGFRLGVDTTLTALGLTAGMMVVAAVPTLLTLGLHQAARALRAPAWRLRARLTSRRLYRER